MTLGMNFHHLEFDMGVASFDTWALEVIGKEQIVLQKFKVDKDKIECPLK